jgi:hypothetical protein
MGPLAIIEVNRRHFANILQIADVEGEDSPARRIRLHPIVAYDNWCWTAARRCLMTIST